MESLFDEQPAQAIIARIETLTAESPAQWGKMNVEEMLRHCHLALGVALGTVTLPRRMIGRLLGWLGKWAALRNEAPFGKNSPTDPDLVLRAPASDAASVEAAKQDLVASVAAFQERGAAGMPTAPHPFFGSLTPAQWDMLSMKHLDHHLRQFGA